MAVLVPPSTAVAGRVSEACCVRVVTLRVGVVTAARFLPLMVAAGA